MEGSIRVAVAESPQQQGKGPNFCLKAVGGMGGRVMGFVALIEGNRRLAAGLDRHRTRMCRALWSGRHPGFCL